MSVQLEFVPNTQKTDAIFKAKKLTNLRFLQYINSCDPLKGEEFIMEEGEEEDITSLQEIASMYVSDISSIKEDMQKAIINDTFKGKGDLKNELFSLRFYSVNYTEKEKDA